MTTFDPVYDQIPVPPELAEEVARRRAWGADKHDEVWDGEYSMSPWPSGQHAYVDAQLLVAVAPHAQRAGLRPLTGFNLGTPRDFRAPDGALVRPDQELAVWNDTAALVVEVLSPGDRAWEKLGFYAEHRVDELVMADPVAQTVVWLARRGDVYAEVDHSELLAVDVADIVGQIDWP